MKLFPIETNTVLLGLRLVEIARTEGLTCEGFDILQRPEFRDYEPVLLPGEIPALRDKINCVVNLDVE